jgi:hypothetical protein
VAVYSDFLPGARRFSFPFSFSSIYSAIGGFFCWVFGFGWGI